MGLLWLLWLLCSWKPTQPSWTSCNWMSGNRSSPVVLLAVVVGWWLIIVLVFASVESCRICRLVNQPLGKSEKGTEGKGVI